MKIDIAYREFHSMFITHLMTANLLQTCIVSTDLVFDSSVGVALEKNSRIQA